MAALFASNTDELQPFDHDGKPAFRAFVYKCPGSGKFVAYVLKYSDDAKPKLEAEKAKASAGAPGPNGSVVPASSNLGPMMMASSLVKKPGPDKWAPQMSADGMKATSVTCPDGKTDNLEPVTP